MSAPSILSSIDLSPLASARQQRVVRGIARGGLVFSDAGLASSLAVQQLPSSPAENLWSPADDKEQRQQQRTRQQDSKGRRATRPRHSGAKDLEHIFSAFPALAVADAALEADDATAAAECSCVICLESCESDAAGTLRCPQCSMCAHATCLQRWFATGTSRFEASSLAPPLMPKSSASCPSCRGPLDWDALALQARRRPNKAKAQPPIAILARSDAAVEVGKP